MIRLYCATGNPGKLREFRLAAGAAPVEIELLPGFANIPPCVEDGATFEENAVIKARHYAQAAAAAGHGRPCCLRTIRGWRSTPSEALQACFRRATAATMATTWPTIACSSGTSAASRTAAARFVCAIALVEGANLRGVYRGAVEGLIVDDPHGAGGFGYDPHFYYPPFGCTFGEAAAEAKFAVSHRGQALRAMLAALLKP